jgi:hypothetical protein
MICIYEGRQQWNKEKKYNKEKETCHSLKEEDLTQLFLMMLLQLLACESLSHSQEREIQETVHRNMICMLSKDGLLQKVQEGMILTQELYKSTKSKWIRSLLDMLKVFS